MDVVALSSSKVVGVVTMVADRFWRLFVHLPMAAVVVMRPLTTLGRGWMLLPFLLVKMVSVEVILACSQVMLSIGITANGCSSRSMATYTLGSGWMISLPFPLVDLGV